MLSERLAFILSLDANGAVKGFQQVGRAADKELGGADARIDRISGNMTKFGAGAVATAGVAGAALFSFAKQAADAEKFTLRLENTLKNQPQLAAANARAFTDLATAIQKKTAADADEIVGAQALLGQFGLTQAKILELTPLVVDLSRKMGIDLDSAAKMVGKSVDGSATALKRAGIVVNETKFKTDAYGATMDALSRTVGGFAEQEGATLAGRIESLKNQFGDLAEGVGVGVIDAFDAVTPAIEGTLGVLQRVDSATQGGIGKFASYGAAALGIVGSMSVLGGQVLRVRDSFTTLAADGTRSLNTLGTAAKTAGIIAGIAAVGAALDEAFAEPEIPLSEWVQNLANADIPELIDAFETLNDLPAEKFMGAFKDVVGQSIPVAQRWRDAIASSGADVSELDAVLADAAQAQKVMSGATDESSDSSDEDTESKRRQAGATRDAADAAREQAAALREAFSAQDFEAELVDIGNALTGVGESSGRAAKQIDLVAEKQKKVDETSADAVSSMDAFRNAVDQVTDAEKDLLKAQKDLDKAMAGPSGEDRVAAEEDLTDARLDAEDANDSVTDAQTKYNEAVAEFGPTSDEARRALNDLSQAKQRAKDAARETAAAEKALQDILTWSAEKAPEVVAARDQVTAAEERLTKAKGDAAKKWGEFSEAARIADETVGASLQSFAESDGALSSNRDRADEAAQAYMRLRDAIREKTIAILEAGLAEAQTLADLDALAARVKGIPGLSDEQRGALLGAIYSAKATAIGLPPGFAGYASGGVVPGPTGAPQLAVVHGGNPVLTPGQRRGGAGVVVNVSTLDSRGVPEAVVEGLRQAKRMGLTMVEV